MRSSFKKKTDVNILLTVDNIFSVYEGEKTGVPENVVSVPLNKISLRREEEKVTIQY